MRWNNAANLSHSREIFVTVSHRESGEKKPGAISGRLSWSLICNQLADMKNPSSDSKQKSGIQAGKLFICVENYLTFLI